MLQENSLCSNGFHKHAEIFQFILLSNSKTRAPVLSTLQNSVLTSSSFCFARWHSAIAITSNNNQNNIMVMFSDDNKNK